MPPGRRDSPSANGAADGADERVLDVQWQTPHLASLGVVRRPRGEYLEALECFRAALALDDLMQTADASEFDVYLSKDVTVA